MKIAIDLGGTNMRVGLVDGADVVEDCCYFLNPDISDDGWFERNCEYYATIGSHKFYHGGLW